MDEKDDIKSPSKPLPFQQEASYFYTLPEEILKNFLDWNLPLFQSYLVDGRALNYPSKGFFKNLYSRRRVQALLSVACKKTKILMDFYKKREKEGPLAFFRFGTNCDPTSLQMIEEIVHPDDRFLIEKITTMGAKTDNGYFARLKKAFPHTLKRLSFYPDPEFPIYNPGDTYPFGFGKEAELPSCQFLDFQEDYYATRNNAGLALNAILTRMSPKGTWGIVLTFLQEGMEEVTYRNELPFFLEIKFPLHCKKLSTIQVCFDEALTLDSRLQLTFFLREIQKRSPQLPSLKISLSLKNQAILAQPSEHHFEKQVPPNTHAVHALALTPGSHFLETLPYFGRLLPNIREFTLIKDSAQRLRETPLAFIEKIHKCFPKLEKIAIESTYLFQEERPHRKKLKAKAQELGIILTETILPLTMAHSFHPDAFGFNFPQDFFEKMMAKSS